MMGSDCLKAVQSCRLLFATSHWPFGSLLLVKRLTQRPPWVILGRKMVKYSICARRITFSYRCPWYCPLGNTAGRGSWLTVQHVKNERPLTAEQDTDSLPERQTGQIEPPKTDTDGRNSFKISVLCLSFAERLEYAGSWRNLYPRKVSLICLLH